jgi:hypothetical protein
MAKSDFDAPEVALEDSVAGVDNRETCLLNRNHTILERAVEKAEKKASSVTKAVQQSGAMHWA